MEAVGVGRMIVHWFIYAHSTGMFDEYIPMTLNARFFQCVWYQPVAFVRPSCAWGLTMLARAWLQLLVQEGDTLAVAGTREHQWLASVSDITP